jgi:demethylspheroidene O-methyltransferase
MTPLPLTEALPATTTVTAPAITADAGWHERWQAWRDRRVRDPRFQRWASGFWLTRGLVRRRARGLFDLMAGFVYSQVLLACVRLNLFEQLADGPLDAATLAARLQLPLDATLRLLDAAVSLDLLERRRGGRYGLGPLGSPMVGQGALRAMVEHHTTLYRDLVDPVALLRHGSGDSELGRCFPYAAAHRPGDLPQQQVAAYSTLMSASQPLVAQEVLDAYPFDRHRVLLDVGGGEGAFVQAVGVRAPHLQLRLFDLPSVAELARVRLAEAGLAQRVQTHGGDFFQDDLPTGADLITLVRVAFDHPDERVLALLRRAHAALPPGGTLLLAEPMADVPGAEAIGDAYFGFYLMAMGRGRPRSAAHLSRLLREAGFDTVQSLPTRLPLQAGLLVAHRRA